MTRLTRYLVRQFFALFFLALIFFIVSLVLGDLLVNLSRLVPFSVPLTKIFYLSILYIPQALSYALSPALLFGVSFVLGTMYSQNELIIVMGSGISLRTFTAPLFLVGACLSVFLFFWNDQGVIPSQKMKNSLTREAQGISSLDNTNVALLADQGKLTYTAQFYNSQAKNLSGVVLIFMGPDDHLKKRTDAEWAEWRDRLWIFHKVRFYEIQGNKEILLKEADEWSDPNLNEKPENFQKKTIEISELSFKEAGFYVQSLKRQGLPYLEPETDFLQRLSFSFSPFVVIWISAAIGGRYKKNILLMSLLTSLLVSAAYIVLQMIFGLLAKTGFLPPLIGALTGVAIGLASGILLFSKART